MFQLAVFYPGSPEAAERVVTDHATDVLRGIPELLDKHPACERIEVVFYSRLLFAVDCQGNRVP